jgi:hypothetical protein
MEAITHRPYLELSDNCLECLELKDLSEIHIPSGVCESCRRRLGLIDRKKQKKELDEIIRKIQDEIFSRTI